MSSTEIGYVSVQEEIGRLAISVHEADSRIDSYVTRTPIVRLPWLDGPGREVWGKPECWQSTGSFKIRGAYNALLRLPMGQKVIAASAGNHGLAVAAAAAKLNLPCKVCVPVNASELKVRRLIECQAEVVPVGKDLFSAIKYATTEAEETGAHYVSAYADWDVIAGQGTCALEVRESGQSFDTVLIPLGGGGLVTGMGSCFRELRPAPQVIAVQPQALARNCKLGGPGMGLTNPVVPTVADGLAVQVDSDCWMIPLVNSIVERVIDVDEDAIETAIYALLHNQGLLVEGAGAVGVAALLRDLNDGEISGRVLVLLSGGNISSTQLSRAMSVRVTDAHMRRTLGLRAITSSLEITSQDHSPSVTQAKQLSDPKYAVEDLSCVWRAMTQQLDHDISELGRIAEQHREYSLKQGLRLEDAVFSAANSQVAFVRQLLKSFHAEDQQQLWRVRSRYRFLIQLLSFLRCVLEWSSASQDQSLEVMFFDPSVQRTSAVNYARYGSTMLRDFELHLTRVLGFDATHQAVLATSSGQAAYQVIESFLLRYVLAAGACVAYSPYIYFEVSEQMRSLPSLRHVVSPSYSVDDLVKTVEEFDAKVLFADPMANITGLPTVDLRALATQIAGRDWGERWLVIDGTMVSGGFNPFAWFSLPGHPRILYFESGSKYLQMGLDLQMAGVCAAGSDVSPRLFRCRRNTGGVMYPPDVNRFPRFTRDQFLTRMQFISRNAERLIRTIQSSGLVPKYVQFGFPQNWESLGWRHGGGVISLLFTESGLNNRDRLEEFISLLLRLCREDDVPLTNGVSFGFGVTRVSASSAMAESSDPFLRLSIGEESEGEMEHLSRVIIKALRIFLRCEAHCG